CRNKALRDAHPVRKLKQFPRWRAVAPNAADGFAGLAMLDQGQRRQAAWYAQNEISPEPFRQGQCDNAVAIRIVSDSTGESDVKPDPRDIDSSIETFARASRAKGLIRTAPQFDQGFPDANDARCLLSHTQTLSRRIPDCRWTGARAGFDRPRLVPHRHNVIL